MLSTFVLSAVLSFGAIGQTVEVQFTPPPVQEVQVIETPQIIRDTYLNFLAAKQRGDRTEMISLADRMIGLLASHQEYRDWLKKTYPNDWYVLLHLRDQIPPEMVVVYDSVYSDYTFYHYPTYDCYRPYCSSRYVWGAISRVLHRAPVCRTVVVCRPCPPKPSLTHCSPTAVSRPICRPQPQVRVTPSCPRPVSRPQSVPRPQPVVHAAPRPAPTPRAQPSPVRSSPQSNNRKK